MVLNIHLDASYLSKTRAQSRVAGHYFMGLVPKQNEPIPVNGNIYVLCGILTFVVASAAEAKLGALFVNANKGEILSLILEELGHPQSPTRIHCDNKTAAGIANATVKKHRARLMEMHFSGSWTKSNRIFLMSNGTPNKKNWGVIIPRLSMESITGRSDHGIYTRKTHHDSSPGRALRMI